MNDLKNLYEQCPYPQYTKIEDEKMYALLKTETFEEGLQQKVGWSMSDHGPSIKVLIAGCGTGSEIIHNSWRMRKYQPSFTAIDLSANSIKMAKERLSNLNINIDVDFHQLSILDIPDDWHETFDFISCLNVLHHNENYIEALQKLRHCLRPDGIMFLQVYATIGRVQMGIPNMRKLAMMITDGIPSMKDRILVVKKIVNQLPDTNIFGSLVDMTDLPMMNDVGVADTLLNPIVKEFTIPELYDWLETCNMKLGAFFGPFQYLYENGIARGDDKKKVHTINELYHGNITHHMFMAIPS
jgi:SAM-dependent methyltransferase